MMNNEPIVTTDVSREFYYMIRHKPTGKFIAFGKDEWMKTFLMEYTEENLIDQRGFTFASYYSRKAAKEVIDTKFDSQILPLPKGTKRKDYQVVKEEVTRTIFVSRIVPKTSKTSKTSKKESKR